MRTLFALLVLAGCDGSASLVSPADFLANATIKKAVDDSQFLSYMGSTPPTVSGKYGCSGQVARSANSDLVPPGAMVELSVCLFNQKGGLVDSAVKAGEATGGGSGFAISGSGANFTIWEELRSSNPGCSEHDAVLYSGTKNGDQLEVSALSIVLDVNGSACGLAAAFWYAANETFTSTGACTGLGDL